MHFSEVVQGNFFHYLNLSGNERFCYYIGEYHSNKLKIHSLYKKSFYFLWNLETDSWVGLMDALLTTINPRVTTIFSPTNHNFKDYISRLARNLCKKKYFFHRSKYLPVRVDWCRRCRFLLFIDQRSQTTIGCYWSLQSKRGNTFATAIGQGSTIGSETSCTFSTCQFIRYVS